MKPAPAHLYRRIAIPAAFLTETRWKNRALRFGGDIRLGDLTGDGQADLLVYRCDTLSELKPCFIGAFTLDGKPLWQTGSGGSQPLRPGPVAVHDINADGSSEVVCFFHRPNGATPRESLADVVVQIRAGATGEILLEKPVVAVRQCAGWGPNWCHQRLLIANLRGTETPQDIVVKLGENLVALDNQLNVLWQYRILWNDYGRCSAYIPAVGDIDRDGRDEINGGYFILDHDGSPLWEQQLAPNMDSVAILPWDDGQMRAICSGGGHVLDQYGSPILALGEAVVPHGQEVRVGKFLPEHPTPQMAIRYKGHTPDVMIVDTEGNIISQFQLNHSPNETGMEVVDWHGEEGPDLLYSGGMLFEGNGNSIQLPHLPPTQGPEKMGWYHAMPGNLCGDAREELLLYNPWASEVFIYTPEPLDESAYRGYSAIPKQYNARLMD